MQHVHCSGWAFPLNAQQLPPELVTFSPCLHHLLLPAAIPVPHPPCALCLPHRPQMVRRLVRAGADVNATLEGTDTPALAQALYKGGRDDDTQDIVQTLIGGLKPS